MVMVSQAKTWNNIGVVHMDNKSLPYIKCKCQYHIIFISKYYKKVLYRKIREDEREITNILCKYKNYTSGSIKTPGHLVNKL